MYALVKLWWNENFVTKWLHIVVWFWCCSPFGRCSFAYIQNFGFWCSNPLDRSYLAYKPNPIELKFCMYVKYYSRNKRQDPKPNQTMTKRCSFHHNFTGASCQKNFWNKSHWGVCTYKGYVIKTTEYGIIWSQNVHFLTNLIVPQNKN